MGKTFRVSGESLLVVGAGIMGLSAAWELSRTGYPVSVFERSFFGSGASGVPYAALWPSAATKKGAAISFIDKASGSSNVSFIN